MNYLGHFYIAYQTQTSYRGALLGDFIKGSNWRAHPLAEQEGILLHRALDQWIDRWVSQKRLTALFTGSARRYAPILSDLYWDYLLARRWETLHALSLQQFSHQVYMALAPETLPPKAALIAGNMVQYDWLNHYTNRSFIERALHRISERLSHPLPIRDLLDQFSIHEAVFIDAFDELLPLLQNLPQQWLDSIRCQQRT